MRLRVCTFLASQDGLSPVSTLIIGSQTAVLLDPPSSVSDTRAIISFIASKTSSSISAVFLSNQQKGDCPHVTFILEAFPTAKFYAAPYVVKAMRDKESQSRVPGQGDVGTPGAASMLARLESYEYSFFALPGDLTSPILLLGPVQGAYPNHTLYWLPTERTVVAGDAVFARSTHVNVEQISSSARLSAWRLTLDLITSLDPATIVAGYIDRALQFDARRDVEHMYRYFDLFEDRIMAPIEQGQPKIQATDLHRVFTEAFANCSASQDLYLRKTINRFAEDGDGPGHMGRNGAGFQAGDLEGFVLRPASARG